MNRARLTRFYVPLYNDQYDNRQMNLELGSGRPY